MTRTSGGRHGAKRSLTDDLGEVQSANRAWWESTPMTYDWEGAAGVEPGSLAWFHDQDRRSLHAHSHFVGNSPFSSLLGSHEVARKDVLEIGVGSGFHAELLTRQGARVTGIDLSRPAIELSKQRFELKRLSARLEAWDAEQDRPDFKDGFDVVWSWGVIHHSAHTARIVRNVHRWLRPGGVFAGMVYHRDSSRLPLALLREWGVRRRWSSSIDEALWRSTDGFSARFYPADQWRDLLLAFFEEACTSVQGLDVDLVPLPRTLRGPVWRRLSPEARQPLRRLGHFLLFRAERPVP